MSDWTFAGPRLLQPRPSWTAAVLAFLFAWQVMVEVPPQYPMYMVVLALGGSAWFTYVGFKARAWVAGLFIPVSLLWLNPLVGLAWFNTQGPMHFLAHAALAMLFGIAAYTYTAREKHA